MKLLLSSISVFFSISCFSQGKKVENDTTYFKSYTKLITARAFLSQKYTALHFKDKGGAYNIDYIPNSKLNFGVGASYKWATFNVAYGIGYLNPDDGNGKTKHLDLQLHNYNEHFTIDLVGQFYEGLYLFPKGNGTTADRYYVRPDIKATVFGGSFQWVFNHRKFSIKATYFQNEWQTKSAGSLLAGVETYGGRIRGDSTLIPTSIDKSTAELNESSIDFFEAGVNIGYIYTLVITRHFFVTGSASASIDYSTTTLLESNGSRSTAGASPNFFFRLITGYNGPVWGLSLIYINNGIRLANETREVSLNTGNLRLSYVRRFELGSKEKKLLRIIK